MTIRYTCGLLSFATIRKAHAAQLDFTSLPLFPRCQLGLFESLVHDLLVQAVLPCFATFSCLYLSFISIQNTYLQLSYSRVRLKLHIHLLPLLNYIYSTTPAQWRQRIITRNPHWNKVIIYYFTKEHIATVLPIYKLKRKQRRHNFITCLTLSGFVLESFHINSYNQWENELTNQSFGWDTFFPRQPNKRMLYLSKTRW